jgi:creatinine amidohydrolase
MAKDAKGGGPRARSRRIDELSWDQLAAEMKRTDIVLVPIGSVEPHGYHSPLGTDTFVADEIAERLASRSGGLIFPPLPLGSMNLIYDVRGYPGAISIDHEVLIRLYTNVGTELARAGFKRIVFVNGHGPNASMLAIASYRIRDQAAVEVGVLEWWATSPEEIRAVKGTTYGTHADEVETSLALATRRGDLVDLGAAVATGDVTKRLSDEQSELYRAKIPFTRTWDERWVGASANMGDPARATKAGGDAIIEKAVATGMVMLRALEEELNARKKAGR